MTLCWHELRRHVKGGDQGMSVVWQEAEREERKRLSQRQPLQWKPLVCWAVAGVVSIVLWAGLIGFGRLLWFAYGH